MMYNFYSKKRIRRYALFLITIMLIHILSPTVSWALTAGPSQPEVQSFEPANTTQMVDLFSGDFTYNIPLFELPGPNGGYPFNLAYHAGIGMDQEASWCGLGWNLNPGTINRQMRGLPDEFKGDEILSKVSMKPSRTIGTGAGVGIEIFGGLGVSGDLSLFYNNYKGAGVEVGASLSYSKSVGGGATAGLSLGISANSQEGIGVNPSLSLSKGISDIRGTDYSTSGSIFVGAGYNSRVGLTGITFGTSTSFDELHFNPETQQKDSRSSLRKGSYSSTLSLSNPGFTPSVGNSMINSSINLSFQLGASWWGMYPNFRFSGFYNEQKLAEDGKNIYTPSYGYLHYQDADPHFSLTDFNREKDGLVREENPNLPIPSLTYDIYSATGQGYSAMYRPLRGDVGIINDHYQESISRGLSLGGDVGPAVAHIGINLTVNHAVSQSGKWEENNQVNDLYAFQEAQLNAVHEPWHFKAHGEPTVTPVQRMEDIGGEDAVMLRLGGNKSNPTATNTLIKSKHNNWSKPAKDNTSYNSERLPRSSVITSVTNEQLKKADGKEAIDLFKIDYVSVTGSTVEYQRNHPDHHLAGFVALTPEGNRYVYALPAYNTHHEEVSFSSSKVTNNTKVDVSPNNSNNDPNHKPSGTNQYLDKKVIPPYAHSYLLTAIVGQDYVDVTGNGVTEDDLGYWVKFTYHQTSSKAQPYKWRAPFSKANYFEGFKTTIEDDRGSYMYGEKEIWYLSRVETKSHIAEFKISNRQDGRGASFKLQNGNTLGRSLSKLDEIVLYTRHAGEATPLKKVKFDYNYELCRNIENGPSNTGKLTLKKLHFEYGNSTRGRLNPYVFDYHADNALENPNYNLQAYDRWGNYKPNHPSDLLRNQEYPYLDQGEPKSAHDLRAGVWSLKEITLPSGGHITVDYEADDYGYVQNRNAMQMLELVDPSSTGSGDFLMNDNSTKMRFKLPVPLSSEEVTDPVAAARPYFESDRDMLYFKLKVNLRSPSENQFDFVTTYASIDKSQPPYLEKGPSGDYEYGCFFLQKEKGHHPLSLRAWQHLRVNQPTLASAVGKVNVDDDNENSIVSMLKGLGSVIPQVRQMFTGFYDYASNRDWGRELAAGKCWVRLQEPNRMKYGGGHRVRQITYKDNWQHNNEGIYGQVYKYTTTDDDGKEISSGVAAYEPLIGGDENPMRYAKKFTESIPLMSNNTLFFEYPVNEGYFPGPQVGYSKVTVMSIASASAAGEEVLHAERLPGKSLFPSKEDGRYGVTGKTEHEFYTARDFPVITDETLKENIPDKTWIPAFPLGTISAKRLASSQGYSIVTNDMHGKSKKVSHFAQAETGEFANEPFSWVKYNYMESKAARGKKVSSDLYNLFVDNGDGTLSKATAENTQSTSSLYHMGQESEFFLDMRMHIDKSYYGGASGNVDIVIIPILFITIPVPIPTVWPSAGKDEKLLKTAVANKVIFKSGIMESIEVYNDGSKIITKNLKWDKLTGRPVLTVVNNNYDKPIYNLEVPAHAVYDGLGPAYESSGYIFSVNSLSALEGRNNYYNISVTATSRKTLFAGDEIILTGEDGVVKGKAVYHGKEGSRYLLYSKENLAEGSYEGFVYRSGRRNILEANAGSISALKDPTQASGTKTYSVQILSE